MNVNNSRRIRQAKRFMGRVAVNFALQNEDLVLKGVRKWLIHDKLGKFTVNDLAYAVENSFDLWDNSAKSDKSFGLGIARDKRVFRRFNKIFTTDLIMQWLKEDKREFWEYIQNDGSGKARSWLNGMLDKVKLRLWEPHISDT